MDPRGEKRVRTAKDQGSGHDKRQKLDGGKRKDDRDKPNWNQRRLNSTLEPGEQGILVTCMRGHEPKAVTEALDLFNEFAEIYYGATMSDEKSEEQGIDIEADIKAELDGMKAPARERQRFTNVTTDTQCILLIKTRPPVEPAAFVQRLCRDLLTSGTKRTRFINRLAPMSTVCKASVTALQQAAPKILQQHFGEQSSAKTFAIRPNLRNYSKELDRHSLIKTVATLVGERHRVDLTAYELLIVAEVYKSMVGLAVVGHDFEELKRFNVAEIYDAARKDPEDSSVEINGTALEEAAPG